jgi:hypothetical protein
MAERITTMADFEYGKSYKFIGGNGNYPDNQCVTFNMFEVAITPITSYNYIIRIRIQGNVYAAITDSSYESFPSITAIPIQGALGYGNEFTYTMWNDYHTSLEDPTDSPIALWSNSYSSWVPLLDNNIDVVSNVLDKGALISDNDNIYMEDNDNYYWYISNIGYINADFTFDGGSNTNLLIDTIETASTSDNIYITSISNLLIAQNKWCQEYDWMGIAGDNRADGIDTIFHTINDTTINNFKLFFDYNTKTKTIEFENNLFNLTELNNVNINHVGITETPVVNNNGVAYVEVDIQIRNPLFVNSLKLGELV